MSTMSRRIARPSAQIELAQRYVDQPSLVRTLGTEGAVDLARVARERCIHTIELRPLLADGCLIPDRRGFTVQVNHSERMVIDPERMTLKDGELTLKQRFTLAHEIAHTFSYDFSRIPPREHPGILQTIIDTGGREPAKSLEDFCQILAGMILIPSLTLKKELDPHGTVDSLDVVLRLARTFRVSPEVLIHRVGQIDETELIRAADYALFMVSAIDGIDQIRAYIYSWTLRGFFEPPPLYSNLSRWIERSGLPVAMAESRHGSWDKAVHGGGVLKIEKAPHKNARSCFVEVKLQQPHLSMRAHGQ